MKGAIPVCKRDLRKFVRQPVMMVAVVLIPLINLVLLGSAFGGAITHAPIAIVRDSYGPLSSSLIGILQNQQSCLFGGTNCQNSFNLENVADLQTAQSMLKEGSVKGIVYIPPNFDAPGGTHDLPVYVDTTDPTSAGAISADLTQAGQQLSIQLQASSPGICKRYGHLCNPYFLESLPKSVVYRVHGTRFSSSNRNVRVNYRRRDYDTERQGERSH